MPIYLPEQNAVFLHVPKTAGESITEMLKKIPTATWIGHKHDSLALVKSYHPEIFAKRPFVFCFVRHPISWYRSYWRFRMGGYKYIPPGDWRPFGPGQPTEELDLNCADSDLNRFVMKCVASYPSFLTKLYKRYYLYSDKEISCIGRYESLDLDLFNILRAIGLSGLYSFVWKSMEKVNVSHGPLHILHTGVAELVLDSEREIIERFYK